LKQGLFRCWKFSILSGKKLSFVGNSLSFTGNFLSSTGKKLSFTGNFLSFDPLGALIISKLQPPKSIIKEL